MQTPAQLGVDFNLNRLRDVKIFPQQQSTAQAVAEVGDLHSCCGQRGGVAQRTATAMLKVPLEKLFRVLLG